MERLRTLRTMVWPIAGIMALGLGMPVVIPRPGSFFLWAAPGLFALMTVMPGAHLPDAGERTREERTK